jgi:hypothetical protein
MESLLPEDHEEAKSGCTNRARGEREAAAWSGQLDHVSF